MCEDKERKEKYAKLWKKDSIEMDDNKLYDWMSSNIEQYNTILEIGCGAGLSTLNLLKRGHNVISIEFNKYCIEYTKSLLIENGYRDVEIIHEQISECNCMNIVEKIKSKIDLVICWNPGGANAFSEDEKYRKLKELYYLGYENPEQGFFSNYAEDFIRSTLKLAQTLNADVHIIDRDESLSGKISDYIDIKEYGFNDIICKNKEGMSNKNTMGEYKKIFYKSFLLIK